MKKRKKNEQQNRVSHGKNKVTLTSKAVRCALLSGVFFSLVKSFKG